VFSLYIKHQYFFLCAWNGACFLCTLNISISSCVLGMVRVFFVH